MQASDTRADTATVESRALVVVEPERASHVNHAKAHPSPAFLAQLLAAKAGLPQTRERRRAKPDEATHSYELTMSPRRPRTGRVLSRAM